MKLRMKNYNTILSGKQQKCQHYLIGEEILPSGQSKIIEQVRFTYSPLGQSFEKQIKIIKEQGKKQVEALKVLQPITQKLTFKDEFLENTLSEVTKTELNKIKEIEKNGK